MRLRDRSGQPYHGGSMVARKRTAATTSRRNAKVRRSPAPRASKPVRDVARSPSRASRPASRAPGPPARRIGVAVLGATGTVGQRFIQLLENHPWFEVAEVMASDQSAGKRYEEAVGSRWKLPTAIPASVRALRVKG